MSLVANGDLNKPIEFSNCCFFTSSWGFKGRSSTTKLRVVFNGSTKTKTGSSLNGYLHIFIKVLICNLIYLFS